MSPEIQAIQAKCAECMEKYRNPQKDCERPHCPLHPFMPYRKQDAGEVVR